MIPAMALASGRVWHQRREPFSHRFDYPLWLVWCELEQTGSLLDRHWAWGRRWRPVTFRDRDYLDNNDTPLAQKARDRAAAEGLDWSGGRVFMLGQWRTLGTLFNPLVLYFHIPEGSDQPDSMLAEVQNTPWREKHLYALRLSADDNGELTVDHSKDFHVSPFLPMALRYHWRLHVAFPELRLTLQDKQGETVVFAAGFTLHLEPPEKAAMGRVIRRFGAQGFATLRGIYWQAWRLWRKGARFYSHPNKADND
ncbi:hypothetical protein A11A3_10861 [Alcanivorax hongdengensis A-11-3]|uniref:DUF1365 domain-containing protein n=1 Tax=Alcanivorax hongdengensis A-11-3 TaxID=1177179 RepID=L0WAL8_9GAMM|nr:DUF1365 domain-containing protein [Alcanivorax hongdengensis]EKF74001.1 hypothetical protein A11A3_10861 [Alcanivorax hongdengensis A-11-3]